MRNTLRVSERRSPVVFRFSEIGSTSNRHPPTAVRCGSSPSLPAGLLKSAWRQPAFKWLRARATRPFKPFATSS